MIRLAPFSGFVQRWRRGQTAPAAISDPAGAMDQEDAAPPEAIAEPPPAPALTFGLVAHIQGLGDRKATEDGWAGRTSGWGKLEGFTATCDAPGWREHVTFQFVKPDRGLSPPVQGGSYCGTRGKMVPLHGFVLHVAAGATEFAGLHYQGVFQDNFRSGLLTPGTLCISPTHAPLLAMRITTDPNAAAAPEYATPPIEQTAGLGANIPQPRHQAAGSHDDAELWDEAPTDLQLIAHISNVGDTPAGKDGWAGQPGTGRSIEGFSVGNARPGWSRDITCRAVLFDGSLGAAVPGGQYCGTRGKGQPNFGFMLTAADGQAAPAGISYEGVFRDGFRSPSLSAGEICASPTKAPLVAMHISIAPPERAAAPENIRLVIWDLDEVFWDGTLTEGGIVWREENAQTVRALAQRGIMSSICSKNDPAAVFALLEQHGMRDLFVFPSINWETKGPRLAALIDDIQLRAPSVLFIDDNPMNRAEAARFVPGLNVWDEQCLADLLRHPRLQGKPDPGLKRLEQYRLLERRHVDRINVGGDTSQFLRDSDITVSIEHDIEPHIDRAVELINRTNQLNFTKSRLPDDPAQPDLARNALRAQLAGYSVQAGLLHVRDRYGDYGFCGLYVVNRDGGGNRLLHFAFSCRILGMGVETWLYRHLKRPTLVVVGEVLADLFDEARLIDWVRVDAGRSIGDDGAQARPLRYVVVRGACDMQALSHYFTNVAGEVIEELQIARAGKSPMIGHSLITSQALRGMPADAITAFAPFGFLPEDFDSALDRTPEEGLVAWLFGFNMDMDIPLYRHIKTAAFLPARIAGLDVPPALMMKGADAVGVDPALVAHLREKFIFFGQRPDPRIDDLFRQSLRVIFGRARPEVRIFVLLSNTHMLNADGSFGVFETYHKHNQIIADIAEDFPNVELLAPQDFMTALELLAQDNANHFDRIVYFRIFQHIMRRLQT